MNSIMKQTYKSMSRQHGEQLLMCTIAFKAGATVMYKKPSTILTFTSNQGMLDLWNKYKNSVCRQLGLEYYILLMRDNSITVILYKENVIKRWMTLEENNEFLTKNNLQGMSLVNQFNTLANGMKEQYPHIIGLYLGIPVQDIKGFIKNSGKNYIFNGYWKVYDNPSKALTTFKSFDNARILSIKKVIPY